MEIKVGEYVRLKNGEIFKIDEDTTNYYNSNKDYITNEITKHSKNIIDLIEIGDYVNGFQVFKTNKQSYLDYAVMVIDGAEDGTYVFKDEIKSIVTKEQFARMEYKV